MCICYGHQHLCLWILCFLFYAQHPNNKLKFWCNSYSGHSYFMFFVCSTPFCKLNLDFPHYMYVFYLLLCAHLALLVFVAGTVVVCTVCLCIWAQEPGFVYATFFSMSVCVICFSFVYLYVYKSRCLFTCLVFVYQCKCLCVCFLFACVYSCP